MSKNKQDTMDGSQGLITTADDTITDKLSRLTDTDSTLSGHVLPVEVKRRIRALNKLQLQHTHLEAKFYADVHKLECYFSNIYSELYTKREMIVNGIHEPTDEECDFNVYDSDDEIPREIIDRMKFMNINKVSTNYQGIPNFWLTIFKNVAMLNDMVQPHDEEILSHLQDIKITYLEKDPMGFVIEFYFSENDYFTNKVLTKVYLMKCTPDEQDPFSYEGPYIYKCKGCSVSWKNGKDVTVKVVKKKQKHKSKGAVRTVTKVVKNDSFFNFFSPPAVTEGSEENVDEVTQALLTTDFEIGHYIRERIVPNAVLYFTGQALEDEEEYEDDDEDDDDDDDDSENISSESDNDSEVYQRGDTDNPNNPTETVLSPECKQQ